MQSDLYKEEKMYWKSELLLLPGWVNKCADTGASQLSFLAGSKWYKAVAGEFYHATSPASCHLKVTYRIITAIRIITAVWITATVIYCLEKVAGDDWGQEGSVSGDSNVLG